MMNSIPYEVDKSSAVPIYAQLASWLEAKITTGEWPPDYRLPGEVELARQLGVSRGSLRKAIGLLLSKNLLVKVHGRGTFVSPFIFEHSWAGRLVGVSEELMLAGIPFETRVLEQKLIQVQPKEAARLDIQPGQEVIFLKRLRLVENDPLVLHESFFRADLYPEIINVDFTRQSLMLTLDRLYDIQLSWASHTLSVVRSGASLAHQLGISVGDPVLYNEHLMYDQNDRKTHLSKSWFRSDRFRLRTVVQRGVDESFYSAMLHDQVSEVEKNKQHLQPTNGETQRIAHESFPKLGDLLPPERIAVNAQVNTWEEAVQLVGRLMVEDGTVEERYIESMISTTRRLGPYIVVAPHLALLHSRPEDGVLQPGFALATLKHPVRFGNRNNDPVSLVVSIAAVDAIQHSQALRQMAAILSDPDNMQAIAEAENKEEVLDILLAVPV